MSRSGVYLLAALLISASAGIAVDDPSGRYDIKYESHLDDQLACGGVVFIISQGSTIHGDSTLGLRGDGKMIGFIKGGTFNAAHGVPADDEVGVDPIPPDDILAYQKTLYFDPELYFRLIFHF